MIVLNLTVQMKNYNYQNYSKYWLDLWTPSLYCFDHLGIFSEKSYFFSTDAAKLEGWLRILVTFSNDNNNYLSLVLC